MDKYKKEMLNLFDGHRPTPKKYREVKEYLENDPRTHYKKVEIKGE